MTTDTTALQERTARAMWDHDNAHMSQQWRDMAWDDMGGSEPSDERIAYLLRATAVLPIIARVRRDAVEEYKDRQVRIHISPAPTQMVPVPARCPKCGYR